MTDQLTLFPTLPVCAPEPSGWFVCPACDGWWHRTSMTPDLICPRALRAGESCAP